MPEVPEPTKEYMSPESGRERQAEINRIGAELVTKATEKFKKPDGTTSDGGLFTIDDMTAVIRFYPEARSPLETLSFDFIGENGGESTFYKAVRAYDDMTDFTITKQELGHKEDVLPAEADWLSGAFDRAAPKSSSSSNPENSTPSL